MLESIMISEAKLDAAQRWNKKKAWTESGRHFRVSSKGGHFPAWWFYYDRHRMQSRLEEAINSDLLEESVAVSTKVLETSANSNTLWLLNGDKEYEYVINEQGFSPTGYVCEAGDSLEEEWIAWNEYKSGDVKVCRQLLSC
jgi:hypothetical protein